MVLVHQPGRITTHLGGDDVVGVGIEGVNGDIEIAGVVENLHLGPFGRRLPVLRFLLRERVDHRRVSPRFIREDPVDLDWLSGTPGLDLTASRRGDGRCPDRVGDRQLGMHMHLRGRGPRNGRDQCHKTNVNEAVG